MATSGRMRRAGRRATPMLGVMRLGFGLFWLVVAGLLFYRGHVAPVEQDSAGTDVGALFALALAGWNVVRWYVARRPAEVRPNPLAHSRPLEGRREQPAEYHPEFDFTRQDP